MSSIYWLTEDRYKKAQKILAFIVVYSCYGFIALGRLNTPKFDSLFWGQSLFSLTKWGQYHPKYHAVDIYFNYKTNLPVTIIHDPFFIIFIASIISILLLRKFPLLGSISLGLALFQLLSLVFTFSPLFTSYRNIMHLFSISLALSALLTLIAFVIVTRGLIISIKHYFKHKKTN